MTMLLFVVRWSSLLMFVLWIVLVCCLELLFVVVEAGGGMLVAPQNKHLFPTSGALHSGNDLKTEARYSAKLLCATHLTHGKASPDA